MLIAQMMLSSGVYQGRQVISQEWLQRMRTPCELASFYGYLLWLNTDAHVLPSAPVSSYLSYGAGGSFVWTEPERELVVVVRWINPDRVDEFFARVIAATDAKP